MPFELMENMSIISLNLENMHSLDNQNFGLVHNLIFLHQVHNLIFLHQVHNLIFLH